jgi:hypothetical protein
MPQPVRLGLRSAGGQAQCLGMMYLTELPSVPYDHPAPFPDQLRLAVAAYLARFKGSSREHTASDLRPAANLAGRTLSDLILGRDTELAHLPWVHPISRRWPPEPFRYIGVRGVNKMMAIADQREWRTARTSVVGRLAHLITGRRLG